MGRYTGKMCRLIFMLVITVIFFVVELVSGYLGNSIALVSDSFNMLSDLISLCVAITASHISRRQTRGPRATYGYTRAEVVGALCNAVFLTALSFTILVDSVLRLARPERIDDPRLVLIVGALGLLVNIVGLIVFQDYGACMRFFRGRRSRVAQVSSLATGDTLSIQDEPEDEELKKDENKGATLNIRGVLLHVLGDALGSVVVVVAASIFYCLPLKKDDPCNWQCYIDPSLTVVMVIIILFSAYPLIKETATILLQMVPKGVDVEEIEGIHAVTLQAEITDKDTGSLSCSSPCISKKCDPQLCCSQLTLFDEANGHAMNNGTSSQVWYRSTDLNTTTDIEISIEPLWGEQIESKGRNITNGLTTESQALNSKSTRF
ncbi:hypothetical protein FKM82_010200 [Ascaphus truei]